MSQSCQRGSTAPSRTCQRWTVWWLATRSSATLLQPRRYPASSPSTVSSPRRQSQACVLPLQSHESSQQMRVGQRKEVCCRKRGRKVRGRKASSIALRAVAAFPSQPSSASESLSHPGWAQLQGGVVEARPTIEHLVRFCPPGLAWGAAQKARTSSAYAMGSLTLDNGLPTPTLFCPCQAASYSWPKVQPWQRAGDRRTSMDQAD